MALTERDIKMYSVILLVVLLGVLAFFIIKPVLLSIIGGLILAYVFFPIYKVIQKRIRSRNIAAALVSIIVLVIIIVPVWLLAPLMVQQAFEFFQFSQNIDLTSFISNLIPSASVQLQSQINLAIANALGKIGSILVNGLVNLLVNFAAVFLHLLLVAFVFFFTLRDSEKLRDFASGLSPIAKRKEKILIKQFKDITQSIIFGQIVIGLLQGIFSGIGLLVFGVPNALMLTIIATILSIIPVIGPSLLYFPVTIYLFTIGNPLIGLSYLIYNLVIVSTLDNFVRAHLIARKSQISSVVALVGMIGGLFIFGVLGLILGPLILAYFITFLRAYKERNLTSFFSS